MKRLIFILFVCVAGAAVAGSPLLITDRIDSKKVTEGMPLVKSDVGKSGNGRVRHRWVIKGHGMGRLEIIGNDQSDADLVGMHCVSYDKQGNGISPVPATARCHKLFVQLLSKFTSTPESFAKKLIEESAQSKATESRRLDDFSLESDGEFYFVRRWSRMR
jgi:hypothetical protein